MKMLNAQESEPLLPLSNDVEEKDFTLDIGKILMILNSNNQTLQKKLCELLGIDMITAKKCIDYLTYYMNNPEKQEKVLLYSRIPEIFDNEMFTISIVNIEDVNIEREMLRCFLEHRIITSHDFIAYLNHYRRIETSKRKVKSIF